MRPTDRKPARVAWNHWATMGHSPPPETHKVPPPTRHIPATALTLGLQTLRGPNTPQPLLQQKRPVIEHSLKHLTLLKMTNWIEYFDLYLTSRVNIFQISYLSMSMLTAYAINLQVFTKSYRRTALIIFPSAKQNWMVDFPMASSVPMILTYYAKITQQPVGGWWCIFVRIYHIGAWLLQNIIKMASSQYASRSYLGIPRLLLHVFISTHVWKWSLQISVLFHIWSIIP